MDRQFWRIPIGQPGWSRITVWENKYESKKELGVLQSMWNNYLTESSKERSKKRPKERSKEWPKERAKKRPKGKKRKKESSRICCENEPACKLKHATVITLCCRRVFHIKCLEELNRKCCQNPCPIPITVFKQFGATRCHEGIFYDADGNKLRHLGSYSVDHEYWDLTTMTECPICQQVKQDEVASTQNGCLNCRGFFYHETCIHEWLKAGGNAKASKSVECTDPNNGKPLQVGCPTCMVPIFQRGMEKRKVSYCNKTAVMSFDDKLN